MIPGLRPEVDLSILLPLAQKSYGTCTYNSEWSHLLIEETPNYLAFSFRGTNPEDITDLETDFSAGKTQPPFHSFEVHAGFYQSSCSVLWCALNQIEAAYKQNKPIYGTGHSKGASEARQTQISLQSLGISLTRIVLWEPARSLSAEALTYVNPISMFGTKYGLDPVPDLPEWFEPEPIFHMDADAISLNPLSYHSLSNVAAEIERLAK